MNNAISNQPKIENQTFIGAQVQIDGGVAYVRCRFVNCTIIVTGLGPIQMEDSKFENPRWSFAGPAGNVLNFLRLLYASGQQELVEQIFQSIRTGVVPSAPAQSVPQTPSGIVQ